MKPTINVKIGPGNAEATNNALSKILKHFSEEAKKYPDIQISAEVSIGG